MTVMPKYLGEVRDLVGHANAGASILVTVAGTAIPASIYADDNTTLLPNPLPVGITGHFEFSANPGAYDLYIFTGPGEITPYLQVTMGSPGGSGAVDSVNTRTGDVVLVGTDLPAFVQSGGSHAPGAVPDPGSTPGTLKFLCEDGTWKTIPIFIGGAGHRLGAVPDPGGAAIGKRALFDDGTWQSPDAFASTYGYTLIQDRKSSGTNGGSYVTGGVWQDRVLNTVVTDTTGSAVLASNQITLGAGSYLFFIDAPAYAVNGHQIKLLNVTDGADVDTSTSEYANGIQNRALLRCRFTIATGMTKALKIQHKCTTAVATNGMGVATSLGNSEIYTSVLILTEPVLTP